MFLHRSIFIPALILACSCSTSQIDLEEDHSNSVYAQISASQADLKVPLGGSTKEGFKILTTNDSKKDAASVFRNHGLVFLASSDRYFFGLDSDRERKIMMLLEAKKAALLRMPAVFHVGPGGEYLRAVEVYLSSFNAKMLEFIDPK